MSDQCMHCTERGDLESCRKTPCGIRESWAFREAAERARAAEVEVERLKAQLAKDRRLICDLQNYVQENYTEK